MINQDTLENQVKSIYLGIGSNLGNKKRNIEQAKFKLSENNIKILQSSSFYKSLSWPNPNNPKFLNIVIRIKTNLKPTKLLNLCKEIEKNLGRKKSVINSPRICDIDVLDFNKKIINKDWVHPVSKKHIKRLILLLSNRDIRSIKQI